MIESLGHRLRLVFQPGDRATTTGLATEVGPVDAGPILDFVAYGEDCLLSGRIRMPADRLTDMLNDHDELELIDVLVEGLADGRSAEAGRIVVTRDDLLLVQATGPRGNQGRRHRTRPHPVALKVGPYQVRGYLHALPGSDAVAAITRRKPMVPLTDAWVDYDSASGHQRHRSSTVVVNREQLDWIVPAQGEEIEFPDLPIKSEGGRLVKDFTGIIFGESTLPASS
jgi:hypothetical protein